MYSSGHATGSTSLGIPMTGLPTERCRDHARPLEKVLGGTVRGQVPVQGSTRDGGARPACPPHLSRAEQWMSSWVLINRVLGSLHTLSPGAKIAVRLQPDTHVLPPRLAAFYLPLRTSWHFGGGGGEGGRQGAVPGTL